VPTAIGVKLANQDIKVIVVGGEGDLYGEGANHFLFAARGNHNITMLVHNNWRYSLTTGQASPTTPTGTITKTTPEGLIEKPFNPLQLALAAHASFVAQGYSGNFKQLKEIIKSAILHRGFALVDILQPCVTFNKNQDLSWYRDNISELTDHDTSNWQKAFALSGDDRTHFKTGVYFQDLQTPAYHEQLETLKKGSLLSQWQAERNLEAVMEDYQ